MKKLKFAIIGCGRISYKHIEALVNNKEEAELLKSEDYRLKCAKAIAYGILEYLEMQPNENTKPVGPTKNNIESGSDEPVRKYKNGSTREDVFADTNCTVKIGSLNPREQCDCFGIYNNRAMVRYQVGKTGNYKIGFCKWLGGVK